MRSINMLLAVACLTVFVGCADEDDPGPSSKDSAGGLPAPVMQDDDWKPGDTPQWHPFDPCASATCNDPTSKFRKYGDPYDPNGVRPLSADPRER